MMYLIFPTQQAAKDRSDEIARNLGCQQGSTDYWFGWTTNETYWALMIPEDETDKLTQAEIESLITEEDWLQ